MDGATPQPEAMTPAEETAAAVALVYCTDAEPGIRRSGTAARFDYHGPNGRRVADPVTLDRIRALAIPPAWAEVWIAADPDAPPPGDGQGRPRPQAIPLSPALDRAAATR